MVEPAPAPIRERRLARWLVLGLLTLTALVFWPATHGGFVWDDQAFIVNNARLRDPARLMELLTSNFADTTTHVESPSLYYRPVISLSYFAQFQVFDLDPRGYHLVSLSQHLFVVLLALDFLRARLGATAGDRRAVLIASGVGAAFFALHPTRTESVSWISGASDLWMALFMLLTARLARPPQVGYARLAAVFVCSALAVLSKEPAAVLPALIWLDGAWLPADARGSQSRRATLSATAGVAVALLLRARFVPLPEQHAASVWLGLPQRVLSTFGHCIEAIVWPFSPTAVRGQMWMSDAGAIEVEPASLAWALGAIAFLGLSGFALRKSDQLRPLLADGAWLALPLLPVLNIMPLGLPQLTSDRYLYVPLLGVAAWLTRGALAGLSSLKTRRHRMLALACLSSVLLAYSGTVLAYGQAYADEHALWDYELERDPDRPYVIERAIAVALARRQYSLAIELAQHGQKLSVARNMPGMLPVFLVSMLQAARLALPDTEQAALASLRDLCDALATTGRGELSLPELWLNGERVLPQLALRVSLTRLQRQVLDGQVREFAISRALLHARTLQPERARELLVSIATAYPRSVEAWSELSMLQARALDFASARDSVARALAAGPAHGDAVRATRALDVAEGVMQHAPESGADRELAHAQVELLLGGIAAARARVAALLAQDPRQVSAIRLAARIDALDRRSDLALQRLDAAAAAQPEYAATWQALKEELRGLPAMER